MAEGLQVTAYRGEQGRQLLARALLAGGIQQCIVVRRFAQSRGLVEPLKPRLGWGVAEPRTYNSGGVSLG